MLKKESIVKFNLPSMIALYIIGFTFMKQLLLACSIVAALSTYPSHCSSLTNGKKAALAFIAAAPILTRLYFQNPDLIEKQLIECSSYYTENQRTYAFFKDLCKQHLCPNTQLYIIDAQTLALKHLRLAPFNNIGLFTLRNHVFIAPVALSNMLSPISFPEKLLEKKEQLVEKQKHSSLTDEEQQELTQVELELSIFKALFEHELTHIAQGHAAQMSNIKAILPYLSWALSYSAWCSLKNKPLLSTPSWPDIVAPWFTGNILTATISILLQRHFEKRADAGIAQDPDTLKGAIEAFKRMKKNIYEPVIAQVLGKEDAEWPRLSNFLISPIHPDINDRINVMQNRLDTLNQELSEAAVAA